MNNRYVTTSSEITSADLVGSENKEGVDVRTDHGNTKRSVPNENTLESVETIAPILLSESVVQDTQNNEGLSVNPEGVFSSSALYVNFESKQQAVSDILDTDILERGQWNSSWEFLMASISATVGLGNVLRFPFQAYENGGGAFLIPFLIATLTFGELLVFIEVIAGQLCSRCSVGMWEMAPIFRGVGWATFISTASISIYYNALVAVCLVYLVYGFGTELPWKNCYWKDGKSDWYITNDREIFKNLTCNSNTSGAIYVDPGTNKSMNISNSQLFYQYVVMQQLDNINDGIGTPHWQLSTSLFVVWTIVFFKLMLGTKSLGKTAYFTAIFPVVILFILFFRAVTLTGAMDGIVYFFKPQWHKLIQIKVWYAAVNQCLFSTGAGYGLIVMFGSYNPLKRNITREIKILGLVDCAISILSGVIVFSILGFLAKATNVDIKKELRVGPNIAFVSYPEVMNHFDGTGARIFCTLFFLMLVVLGLSSGSAMALATLGTIFDFIPYLKQHRRLKITATAFVCYLFACFGLIFTTPGGSFMLNFYDYFLGQFVVYVVVMFELAAVAWVYGMRNFARDIEFIFDKRRGGGDEIFITWGYVSPGIIFFLLVVYIMNDHPLSFEVNAKTVMYPTVLVVVGWIFSFLVVALIPIVAIITFFTRETKSYFKKWMACVCPTANWGPRLPKDKKEWKAFKKLNYIDGQTVLWKKTFGKCCRKQRQLFLQQLEENEGHKVVQTREKEQQTAPLDKETQVEEPEESAENVEIILGAESKYSVG